MTRGVLRHEPAHRFGRREKEVQVVAGDAQHGAMEHGVDIVRAAFERDGSRPRAFSADRSASVTVVLPVPLDGAAIMKRGMLDM